MSRPRTVIRTIIDLKYGVKKDGTLTAIQAKVVADGGAYAMHSARRARDHADDDVRPTVAPT